MAKIRDLGINVVPTGMRPREIGIDRPVPFYMECPNNTACNVCPCDNTARQDTSNDCVVTSRQRQQRHASGFTHDAVAQLKQQLRGRTGRQLAP
jgi:hypothetical protein